MIINIFLTTTKSKEKASGINAKGYLFRKDFLKLVTLDKKGNIRDYATINELICLSNMENINAVFIADGMPQSERLKKLNQIAISQMKVLNDVEGRKLLK